MIAEVNRQLKEGVLARGWHFLDVYAATVGEDGTGNAQWHLDGWHLQPMFYTQADRWLVKPPAQDDEQALSTSATFEQALVYTIKAS